MVQYASEESRQRKEMLQKAIQHAMNSEWQEAIAANKAILSLSPEDAEAYNRLGKAYMSLQMYDEAQSAYQHAIRLMPHNTIAEKNLKRITQLLSAGEQARAAAAARTAGKVDATVFIEETGKTGVTVLIKPGDRVVLVKVMAGDPVALVIEGQRLVVKNGAGEYLGQIETRLGKRLTDLMNAGNRYTAAITNLTDHSVKIIIRETFQHPSQLGKISFPKQGAGLETVRPYIKGSVIMYDYGDEEDELSDEEFEEETEEEGEAADEDSEFESDIAEE
jgi:tetratricopeptide (TPR) repeat protein